MTKLKAIVPGLGLTILLAALTALQPLSTDMYLPSLLNIAAAFNTDMAHVQLTLSLFLVGFAVGQIFYGPFADKYGRKPVLLVGMAIYMVGTLVCINAATIEYLVIGRLLQAFGGSGPIVLARTIVRDMLKGPAAGKMLSLMGFILGFVPMIAPIFGGYLETAFGWQSHFYVFLICATLLGIAVILFLPETNQHKTRETLTPIAFFKIYNGLLSSSVYRFFISRIALTYGGMFAFISGSSYYVQTRFELTPEQYGFTFASVVVGYMFGTLAGANLAMKLGTYKAIYYGTCLQAIGGILMVGLHLIGVYHVAQVAVPMFLFLAGAGFVLPQSQAGSMSDFPHKAGAASSLAGVFQVGVAAIFGTLTGVLIEDYILIMPSIIVVLGIINFIPSFTSRNKQL